MDKVLLREKIKDMPLKKAVSMLLPEELEIILHDTLELQPLSSKLKTTYKRVAYFIHNIKTDKRCKACGSILPFKELALLPIQNYCNNSCKHADPHFRDNLIAKLRSDASDITNKRKETFIKKYGVDNAMKIAEVRNKIKDYNFEKYGVSWSVNRPDTIKKRIASYKNYIASRTYNKKDHPRLKLKYHDLLESTNYIPMFEESEYNGIETNGTFIPYKFFCIKCNNVFENHLASWNEFKCTCCESITNKYEEFIEKILLRNNIEYVKHNRKLLDGLELDFFIPSLNIAIEVNGIYYHSTRYIKDPMYHINKTILCNQKGIKLIHIFTDEIKFKSKAVINRLYSILNINKIKIGARKCVVKIVCQKQANNFIEKYHTQGNINGSHYYGIFYKNRLLSVMSFGKQRISTGRRSKENVYELYRFCTINNVQVIGGANKMLKMFIKDVIPEKIISYCDVRYSPEPLSNVYKAMGLTYMHTSVPNYWIVRGDRREHRFGYRKSVLKNKLEIFNENVSEKENQEINNIYRVYDCGSHTYEKCINKL